VCWISSDTPSCASARNDLTTPNYAHLEIPQETTGVARGNPVALRLSHPGYATEILSDIVRGERSHIPARLSRQLSFFFSVIGLICLALSVKNERGNFSYSISALCAASAES
jgi:hypothetical protein